MTDLVRYRALIQAFAARDFSTRYRSSALGWLWSLLQPLASLLVYAAVFSLVFRIQAPPLGSDAARTSFAAFLFTGMVTWNAFSGILTLNITQLRSNADLLRKVSFPAWAPLLGSSIGQLFQIGLEVLVLMGMFVFLLNVGISWILMPFILLAVVLFAQGVALMLSIANAHFGDVQYIVTVVLGALYFLTPILYPLSMVQDSVPWMYGVVLANPMTWFVEPMHMVMYSLEFPPWWVVPALLAFGALVFYLGLRVFNRYSEDLGEIL